MVKNEHYMEVMSETFDYTLQVYLDQNPKICSQCMIFGSNKADFFHKPLVEHGVETLLLEPVERLEDGYDYFHDFRKNDAIAQGKCNLNTDKKNETTQTKSAGLLHILDAEDVAVTLDNDTIKSIILIVAEEQGFTTIEANDEEQFSTDQYTAELPDDPKSSVVTVVFKEGYATARIWPKDKYVAVDVGIWGSFQEGDNFRKRIGEELKAETTSFFRVVVGGMFGSSTWEQDKDIIGPQIVQQRNCEESKVEDVEFSDDIAKKTVIDEAINIAGAQKSVAAVFCGIEGVDECPSLAVLEQHVTISKVIPVWACPELSGDFSKMSECEDKTISTLMEGRGIEGDGIATVVLDGSTPYEMGQILISILTVPSLRDLLLENNHYVMTMSNKPKSETWQRNMLDRYRKELYYDPAKVVQFDITVGDASMELGVLSHNDMTGFKSFKSLEEKISKGLARDGVAASAEVKSITGALFPFMHDYDPREYVQEDYPVEPGAKQYAAQNSLGRKTVVQYDLNKNHAHYSMPDLNGFVRLIDSFVTEFGLYQFKVYTDVGDGVVIVTESKLGSVIAIWDGKEHVDLNIFMHDDTELEIKEVLDEFTKHAGKKLNMGLRDDFPRGTGRVMNFRADMTYTGFDSILDLLPYVDDEDDA